LRLQKTHGRWKKGNKTGISGELGNMKRKQSLWCILSMLGSLSSLGKTDEMRSGKERFDGEFEPGNEMAR
jgi:hypothetical protein